MYNSPMNSISSPQQSSNNQVAPPSPLDVSVPRPSSQTGGNVAYPSVITRALNPEKNFPADRYERPTHNNHQNPNCWDDRQNQRKYPNNPPAATTNTSNNYNSNTNLEMNRNEQQNQQRVLISVGERQQTYFDTNTGHQVTLQDLSSCRGDPMTIVKNLQQQSCQVPQSEIKTEVKPPIKRRKSSDKQPVQELQNLSSSKHLHIIV